MDATEWLRTQLTSFGCAACGQPYEAGRIRLLAQREGLFFVDLACTACGSQAVAIVTVGEAADGSPTTEAGELVVVDRDGRPLEVRRDPDGPRISADDVLDVHALLEGLECGMDTLLARLDGQTG